MSKGQEKRQFIFNKYIDNINLLIDNGLIDAKKDMYLCPICLRQHVAVESENPLTLEDAPPKSLGGSASTLTCKSCNNTCGHKIDFHLTERLKEIDNAKFLPNTNTPVKIKFGGEVLQGEIIIDGNGVMKMHHSKRNNDPNKLERIMKTLKAGSAIDMNFFKSRVIPEKLEYALLKTGYIMLFEKFGYSLILDNCYDIVREQLLNPESRIYSEGFWFTPPYPKEMQGVYFVCDKGLECIVALFNLNTGSTERMYGVMLPLPVHPIGEVIKRLNDRFDEKGDTELILYPFEQGEMNYISDLKNINAMHKWIEEKKGAE